MGLPQILDQVAIKARGVSGIAAASGAGVTPGVAGMPAEIPGFPFAMCLPGGAEASQGRVTTTWEQIQIRLYVPAASLPAGGAILAGAGDLFETAWRTDRDLAGTCLDSEYLGYDPIEREDWGGVPCLVLPLKIRVLRIVTGTLVS